MRGGVIIALIVCQFYAVLSHADSKTKAQLLVQMQPYITAAKSRADSRRANTQARLPAMAAGQNPKWYGGNNEGVIAIHEDFLVNLLHDFPNGFLDCLDFKISNRGCNRNRLGIPRGLYISYRAPMQQILSKRFFQNRYAPEFMMDLLKQIGYYEDVFYGSVKNFHAPLAILHASLQQTYRLNQKSWAPYALAHGVIGLDIDFKSADFPLNRPAERGRYDGGKIGETDLNQLEYGIGPPVMQVAWTVVANYYEWLKEIPCLPPYQSPGIFQSEDPAMIDLTRNPFLGFLLYEDTELRDDLTEWILNPGVCQEWMMNRNRQNIPHDLVKANADPLTNPHSWLISAVPGLDTDMLVPLSNSELAQFDRMCTRNWGGSIPFTTMHQVSDTGFIDAGKNFLKTTRLGVALGKTFIDDTSASEYVKWYPVNKGQDAYQLTYKEEWDCKSVGTPAKPFNNANTHHTTAEHGLYSMTHWMRLPRCCMGFGDIWDMLEGMGS